MLFTVAARPLAAGATVRNFTRQQGKKKYAYE
jgi:hypothetical protein